MDQATHFVSWCEEHRLDPDDIDSVLAFAEEFDPEDPDIDQRVDERRERMAFGDDY